MRGKSDIYKFSDNIEHGLEIIKEDFVIYKKKIQENSVVSLLKLLSNLFVKITFEELKKFTHFTDFQKVR